MMNHTANRISVPLAVPEFDVLGKLAEGCSKEQIREQEITKFGEMHSRAGGRWPRQMTLDAACRAPSLFTWRC